jgi:hypothetical protein
LALVILWHRFLGLRIQKFVFGVLLGMGVWAGFEPLVHALRSSTVVNTYTTDLFEMGVYHISVLIWLYFVQVREVAEEVSRPVPFVALSKWNAELGRFLQL